MKKFLSLMMAAFFISGSISCKLNVQSVIPENTSDPVILSLPANASNYSEIYKDCYITPTDLGSWNNSVVIDAGCFSSMKSGDYLIIKTESNNSNDDRQLQLSLNEDSQNITILGSYNSLSDSTYLNEWKCYTLYNGYQETRFFPVDSEISGLKEKGLLIKGKGVKVVSVKIHETEEAEIPKNQDSENEEIKGTYIDSEKDCGISPVDLGSWNNSVEIPAECFTKVQSGKYIIIKTESNNSNDDRQLQLCLNDGPENVTILGSYNSLSDSTYLNEWKCYTLYNGYQETRFFPADWELESLKEKGLLIKGKGVKVVSVKVLESNFVVSESDQSSEPETPVEPEEPVLPENPSEPDTPVIPDTPELPENQPAEKTETENDPAARITHDCKITASDLGDAWAWEKKVDIPASHFSEMEDGDYISITTDVSTTSKKGTLPQLKLGSNVNWNLQAVGSSESCTNIEYYNSEYQTYTLNAYAQVTRFTPSASDVEKISKNGLIIQGQGVTVTKVTVHTKDYNAENPNKTGDSTGTVISSLSDPLATNNAKRLYNFINANYGKKVITGQMENAWDNSFKMLDKVYADTGKYPALMGFDFIDYTVDWAIESDFNIQTERAINFWNGKDYKGKKISNSNGIVTFCWHWKDPMKETQNESYKPEELNFRIPYDLSSKSWKTSTPEYKAMVRDMDLIASELLRLQEAGVPVIWRPLHEGAGNVGVYNGGTAWFWWGAGTSKADATNENNCAQAYIALWQFMYNYYTNIKGIHNLIWLWNGQNEKFYPGDRYVDMIGDDIYSQGNYSSQANAFNRFQTVNRNLPVALSECGSVPTLENMKKDNAMWSFFMVWNDASNTFGGSSDNFWGSNNHNPLSHKLELYNSPLAITLDDVGDLTQY